MKCMGVVAMERNKFLNMARECAMIRDRGLFNVRQNVPDRLRVIYKDIEYYPQAYELAFFDDGSVNHIAIIHDLKANSICHVPLKEVFEKER